MDLGPEKMVGQLAIVLGTTPVHSHDRFESLPKLTEDCRECIRLLIASGRRIDVIEGALSELLEGGFDGVGNGLINGLEITLPVVCGLNAGVAEGLDPSATISGAR